MEAPAPPFATTISSVAKTPAEDVATFEDEVVAEQLQQKAASAVQASFDAFYTQPSMYNTEFIRETEHMDAPESEDSDSSMFDITVDDGSYDFSPELMNDIYTSINNDMPSSSSSFISMPSSSSSYMPMASSSSTYMHMPSSSGAPMAMSSSSSAPYMGMPSASVMSMQPQYTSTVSMSHLGGASSSAVPGTQSYLDQELAHFEDVLEQQKKKTRAAEAKPRFVEESSSSDSEEDPDADIINQAIEDLKRKHKAKTTVVPPPVIKGRVEVLSIQLEGEDPGDLVRIEPQPEEEDEPEPEEVPVEDFSFSLYQLNEPADITPDHRVKVFASMLPNDVEPEDVALLVAGNMLSADGFLEYDSDDENEPEEIIVPRIVAAITLQQKTLKLIKDMDKIAKKNMLRYRQFEEDLFAQPEYLVELHYFTTQNDEYLRKYVNAAKWLGSQWRYENMEDRLKRLIDKLPPLQRPSGRPMRVSADKKTPIYKAYVRTPKAKKPALDEEGESSAPTTRKRAPRQKRNARAKRTAPDEAEAAADAASEAPSQSTNPGSSTDFTPARRTMPIGRKRMAQPPDPDSSSDEDSDNNGDVESEAEEEPEAEVYADVEAEIEDEVEDEAEDEVDAEVDSSPQPSPPQLDVSMTDAEPGNAVSESASDSFFVHRPDGTVYDGPSSSGVYTGNDQAQSSIDESPQTLARGSLKLKIPRALLASTKFSKPRSPISEDDDVEMEEPVTTERSPTPVSAPPTPRLPVIREEDEVIDLDCQFFAERSSWQPDADAVADPNPTLKPCTPEKISAVIVEPQSARAELRTRESTDRSSDSAFCFRPEEQREEAGLTISVKKTASVAGTFRTATQSVSATFAAQRIKHYSAFCTIIPKQKEKVQITIKEPKERETGNQDGFERKEEQASTELTVSLPKPTEHADLTVKAAKTTEISMDVSLEKKPDASCETNLLQSSYYPLYVKTEQQSNELLELQQRLRASYIRALKLPKAFDHPFFYQVKTNFDKHNPPIIPLPLFEKMLKKFRRFVAHDCMNIKDPFVVIEAKNNFLYYRRKETEAAREMHGVGRAVSINGVIFLELSRKSVMALIDENFIYVYEIRDGKYILRREFYRTIDLAPDTGYLLDCNRIVVLDQSQTKLRRMPMLVNKIVMGIAYCDDECKNGITIEGFALHRPNVTYINYKQKSFFKLSDMAYHHFMKFIYNDMRIYSVCYCKFYSVFLKGTRPRYLDEYELKTHIKSVVMNLRPVFQDLINSIPPSILYDEPLEEDNYEAHADFLVNINLHAIAMQRLAFEEFKFNSRRMFEAVYATFSPSPNGYSSDEEEFSPPTVRIVTVRTKNANKQLNLANTKRILIPLARNLRRENDDDDVEIVREVIFIQEEDPAAAKSTQSKKRVQPSDGPSSSTEFYLQEAEPEVFPPPRSPRSSAYRKAFRAAMKKGPLAMPIDYSKPLPEPVPMEQESSVPVAQESPIPIQQENVVEPQTQESVVEPQTDVTNVMILDQLLADSGTPPESVQPNDNTATITEEISLEVLDDCYTPQEVTQPQTFPAMDEMLVDEPSTEVQSMFASQNFMEHQEAVLSSEQTSQVEVRQIMPPSNVTYQPTMLSTANTLQQPNQAEIQQILPPQNVIYTPETQQQQNTAVVPEFISRVPSTSRSIATHPSQAVSAVFSNTSQPSIVERQKVSAVSTAWEQTTPMASTNTLDPKKITEKLQNLVFRENMAYDVAPDEFFESLKKVISEEEMDLLEFDDLMGICDRYSDLYEKQQQKLKNSASQQNSISPDVAAIDSTGNQQQIDDSGSNQSMTQDTSQMMMYQTEVDGASEQQQNIMFDQNTVIRSSNQVNEEYSFGQAQETSVFEPVNNTMTFEPTVEYQTGAMNFESTNTTYRSDFTASEDNMTFGDISANGYQQQSLNSSNNYQMDNVCVQNTDQNCIMDQNLTAPISTANAMPEQNMHVEQFNSPVRTMPYDISPSNTLRRSIQTEGVQRFSPPQNMIYQQANISQANDVMPPMMTAAQQMSTAQNTSYVTTNTMQQVDFVQNNMYQAESMVPASTLQQSNFTMAQNFSPVQTTAHQSDIMVPTSVMQRPIFVQNRAHQTSMQQPNLAMTQNRAYQTTTANTFQRQHMNAPPTFTQSMPTQCNTMNPESVRHYQSLPLVQNPPVAPKRRGRKPKDKNVDPNMTYPPANNNPKKLTALQRQLEKQSSPVLTNRFAPPMPSQSFHISPVFDQGNRLESGFQQQNTLIVPDAQPARSYEPQQPMFTDANQKRGGEDVEVISIFQNSQNFQQTSVQGRIPIQESSPPKQMPHNFSAPQSLTPNYSPNRSMVPGYSPAQPASQGYCVPQSAPEGYVTPVNPASHGYNVAQSVPEGYATPVSDSYTVQQPVSHSYAVPQSMPDCYVTYQSRPETFATQRNSVAQSAQESYISTQSSDSYANQPTTQGYDMPIRQVDSTPRNVRKRQLESEKECYQVQQPNDYQGVLMRPGYPAPQMPQGYPQQQQINQNFMQSQQVPQNYASSQMQSQQVPQNFAARSASSQPFPNVPYNYEVVGKPIRSSELPYPYPKPTVTIYNPQVSVANFNPQSANTFAQPNNMPNYPMPQNPNYGTPQKVNYPSPEKPSGPTPRKIQRQTIYQTPQKSSNYPSNAPTPTPAPSYPTPMYPNNMVIPNPNPQQYYVQQQQQMMQAAQRYPAPSPQYPPSSNSAPQYSTTKMVQVPYPQHPSYYSK